MNLELGGLLLPRLAAVGVPLTFGLASLAVSRAAPFRRAIHATSLAAALVVTLVGGRFIAEPRAAEDLSSLPSLLSAVVRGVRVDVVTEVMLALVCTLAIVIVRYSRTYLDGDSGRPRYARALLVTLGTVTTLVIANNLLVIALAWMGTSFALHQLLTFYRERPSALIAAHKKFLLSRLADVCLLSAILVIGRVVGSLDLDALSAWASSHGALPASLQVTAGLLVIGVALKSAQIPFHGWLTQVMEAPTPVSALLHAGVVNIGGFLMIRLSPFMTHAPFAQALLVLIGMTTAVVAALVMTTRVSVKVSLAWSTCAQMGFMLAQCGLGAWDLALLHLVAHSFYKAYAFLGSGSAVDGWRVQAIAPRRGPLPLAPLGLAALVVLAIVGSGYAAFRSLETSARPDGTLAPLAFVLGLSLLPFAAHFLAAERRSTAALALRVLGVVSLYLGWHAAFRHLVPPTEVATSPAWLIVIIGFALLFGLQVALQVRPAGSLARALQPHLFAGLYLDELFTRMTFRLWPPRLQPLKVTRTPPSVAEARLETTP